MHAATESNGEVGSVEIGDRVTADIVAISPTPSDDVSFAAWVSPHLAVLSALAVREVGRPDAEDVVQETLLRAWRRRSTFDSARGPARAWLAAILLDQSRRHRVRHVKGPDPVQHHHESGATQPHSEVESAIQTLPRRQREVVTLHYLLDLPVRDIARVLSISEGSVKSTLHDARANLRTALEAS